MKNLTGGDFCGGLPRAEAMLLAQAAQTRHQEGRGHLSDARAIGASTDATIVDQVPTHYNNPCLEPRD